MEQFFGGLAFAGLIAAQFLGVVFVAHQNRKVRSSGACGSYKDDPRITNIGLVSE